MPATSRPSPTTSPGDHRPPQLPGLTWDQYEALRFRPDHALWADTDLPFQVQFFHLGIYYRQRCASSRSTTAPRGDRVRPQPVRLSAPTTLRPAAEPPIWASPAGACTSTPTSRRTSRSSWAPPISAPPTRQPVRHLLPRARRGQRLPQPPEEFPIFTRYWLVRPRPTDTVLTVYALLESESIDRRLPFRHLAGRSHDHGGHRHLSRASRCERLGIAPMTSMFWFGENERRVHRRVARGDPRFRRARHVARQRRVGLAAADQPAAAARLLVPRREPPWLRPAAARPRLRPLPGRGVPLRGAARRSGSSRWTTGARAACHLVEIPTADETFDNIVAFWTPLEPPCPGGARAALPLHWCPRPAGAPAARPLRRHPHRPRRRHRLRPAEPRNLRKFVVDFAGGDLPLIPAAPRSSR